jgi:hypothetical protein
MTGSAGLQQKGHEQHARGQAKYDKAQGQGYTKATKERVGGVKDSIIGAVQGNEARKAQGKSCVVWTSYSYNKKAYDWSGKFRRDKGSAQQGLSGLWSMEM